MSRAIIVDIDGTLADCEHRRKFLLQTPKDWKSFHDRCDRDSLNVWCADLLCRYQRDHTIILVSGRVRESYQKTVDWLDSYDVPYAKLFMREKGDYRDDTILKKEIYEREIKGIYEVTFVLDDRKRLAEMWRAEGLTVLHCAEGNF